MGIDADLEAFTGTPVVPLYTAQTWLSLAVVPSCVYPVPTFEEGTLQKMCLNCAPSCISLASSFAKERYQSDTNVYTLMLLTNSE